MLKKVSQDEINNKTMKLYKSEDSIGTMDIINGLQEADRKITNIYVSEEADVGMKSFEGNYSLENFIIKYDDMPKDEISSIRIELENGIFIFINNATYISMTMPKNIDIEINDLFSQEITKKME